MESDVDREMVILSWTEKEEPNESLETAFDGKISFAMTVRGEATAEARSSIVDERS